MSEYAKKLEAEADELLMKHYGQQSEGEATEDAQEADEGTPEPTGEKPEQDQKADEPAQETPPEEDTGVVQDELDGLTLHNASERIKNAQARMHRATQEAADLRRALATKDQELSQLRTEVDALKAAPPAKQSESAQDGISLDELATEYPETLGPVLEYINAMGDRVKQLEAARNTDATKPADTVVAAATPESQPAQDDAAVAHYATIYAAHPDAQDLAGQPEFQGWVTRQGPQAQAILDRGTAQQVVALLTAYKTSVGQAQRRKEAAAAADPTVPTTRKPPVTAGQPKFTREQIKAMSPAEYAKREAEIDDAMAKGLIV